MVLRFVLLAVVILIGVMLLERAGYRVEAALPAAAPD